MTDTPSDTRHNELMDELTAILGIKGILIGEEATQHATGWSRLGSPIALIRPANTQEVSDCVKACAQHRIPMVPWGGLTGLVSGAMADNAIAFSMDRMQAVEQVSTVNSTMLVQAGCVLQAAADAAAEAGLLLPLDLGSRGSATIGGNVSTNAGGNRVVRFGMTRDMVLGLEAVLADGTIVSSLMPLLKNNTGYDLKQLFIGGEGTLGIVTRVALRLRPAYPSHNAAFVALDDFADVAKLLRQLEARLGGQLSAFEAMWPKYYELVTSTPARGRKIVPGGHAFYVLIETMGGDIDADRNLLESALAEAMENGLIVDAVIAQSEGEIADMWGLRDDVEQIARIGAFTALDVSLRLTHIAPFTQRLNALVDQLWPGKDLILLGHVGDGNIHIVVGISENTPEAHAAVAKAVLALVCEFDGSVSAEHGIGLDKREYLPLSRSEAELSTMRLIKKALDPLNLMNPGKVIALTDV